MNHINNALIQGYLCRNPAVRALPSGAVVANFTLASHTRHTNRAGQTANEIAFVSCVAWGKAAEALADHQKDQLLVAVGRLRNEEWQQRGEPRHRLVMLCESVHTPQLANDEPAAATRIETERTVPPASLLSGQPPF
jgi:single-strand DNA-binding protein